MPIRRFFHRTTIIRRSKKMISIIKKAKGVECTSRDSIEQSFMDYFSSRWA